MANVIVHPPGSGPRATSPIIANGRTYTPVPGTPQTVPEQDGAILAANGWLQAGGDVIPVGATAARPANPTVNQRFIDTTTGAELLWDGVAWRHQVTGGTP